MAEKSQKDFQALLRGAADRMRDVATGTVNDEYDRIKEDRAKENDAFRKLSETTDMDMRYRKMDAPPLLLSVSFSKKEAQPYPNFDPNRRPSSVTLSWDWHERKASALQQASFIRQSTVLQQASFARVKGNGPGARGGGGSGAIAGRGVRGGDEGGKGGAGFPSRSENGFSGSTVGGDGDGGGGQGHRRGVSFAETKPSLVREGTRASNGLSVKVKLPGEANGHAHTQEQGQGQPHRSPTERSPTERSPTQRSPTQRSPTQRSPTQRSPTQWSPTERSTTQQSLVQQRPPVQQRSPAPRSPADGSPVSLGSGRGGRGPGIPGRGLGKSEVRGRVLRSESPKISRGAMSKRLKDMRGMMLDGRRAPPG
eukprot:jgi/Undpi1/13419/HiC_scaffold_8.g03078.m1